MNIHKDFPSVTKSEWLAQIAKDLKGAPLEGLSWKISERVVAQPLVDHTNLPEQLYPLSEKNFNWEIGEHLVVSDPVLANAVALEALNGGASGLTFHLAETPTETDFDLLFRNIHLDFVGLHFEGPALAQNPGLVLALLAQLAKKRNLSTAAFKGSLHYDPEQQSNRTDWRYLTDLIAMAHREFPGFKVLTLRESPGTGTPDASLADVMARAQQYMVRLVENGSRATAVTATIKAEFMVGQHYFVEIARLRAFQILWLNWCQRWGTPLDAPVFSAIFNPAAYTDAIYTNLIRATTMAMSAALGGANSITVLPYDEGREDQAEYPKAFARRMARNVQHLLQLESGLNTLTDPAAGSYYIEHLTSQIANAAWENFASRQF